MSEPAAIFAASRWKRKLSKAAWAVVVVGVLLRCGLQVVKVENLATDPDAYVQLSESLVTGHGFSKDGTDLPTAFRPPVFPVVLAGVQWLGFSIASGVAIVQLFFSGLLLIATWKLARLMGLSDGPAVCALCFVACDPLLLLYSTLPMTEVPSAAFLAWAAVHSLGVLNAMREGRFRSAGISGVMAGACFGVGGLCRPILFVACAGLSVVLFLAGLSTWRQRSRHRQPTQIFPTITVACVPACVAAIVLSGWVVRNAVQMGSFIPATTHGGYTLLLGNNPVFYAEVVGRAGHPTWHGVSLNRWNLDLDFEMAKDDIGFLDEVGRDRWMYNRAKLNIANNPSSFRRACLLRLRRLTALVPVNAVELPTIALLGVGAFYSTVWLGLVLNVFSLVRPMTGHRVASLLLWSVAAAFVLIHCFYWTNTRMRAPLMPVLIVLAISGYAFAAMKFGSRVRNLASDDAAAATEAVL